MAQVTDGLQQFERVDPGTHLAGLLSRVDK